MEIEITADNLKSFIEIDTEMMAPKSIEKINVTNPLGDVDYFEKSNIICGLFRKEVKGDVVVASACFTPSEFLKFSKVAHKEEFIEGLEREIKEHKKDRKVFLEKVRGLVR